MTGGERLTVAQGLGELDYAAMGRLREKWAAVDFTDEAAR